VVLVFEMRRGDVPSHSVANIVNKYTVSVTRYFLQIILSYLD